MQVTLPSGTYPTTKPIDGDPFLQLFSLKRREQSATDGELSWEIEVELEKGPQEEWWPGGAMPVLIERGQITVFMHAIASVTMTGGGGSEWRWRFLNNGPVTWGRDAYRRARSAGLKCARE